MVSVGFRQHLVIEQVFESLLFDVPEQIIHIRGAFGDSSFQADLIVDFEANSDADVFEASVYRLFFVIFDMIRAFYNEFAE